jgi:dihydroflavonol-4-reductase
MFACVTGASGHLGVNLVRALLARGWTVRALVHQNTRGLEGLAVERVYGDVLDVQSLGRAFTGVDTVFHLAGRISVVGWDREDVEAVNIAGVRNVVAACRDNRAGRLVHTSSFHAHRQEPLDEPLSETRPLVDSRRFPPYNYSKAEGERVVRQAIAQGLDAIIVSPTGMIGPYDFQPSHFGATLLAMARGKLPVLVNAGLDWVDTRDVAEGMIRACERAGAGEKYFLSGHWVSLTDIAQVVSQVSGRRPPRLAVPLGLARAAAPLAEAFVRLAGKRALFTSISMKELGSNRQVSHERATRELDYEPRPFQATLSDTLNWYRANGLLPTR